MQVIRRLDSGERQSQISAALNLATSTLRTIPKNKEKILSSATATASSSGTRITRSRNNVIEEMEKRQSIWIDHEIERNMPLSQSIIMEKARRIFNCIQVEVSDIRETFVASRGWFNRFKHRNNPHNIKITGEAASGDTKVAAEFPATLKTIIEQGNYPLELVFNVDETGLFWKRMPKRTFLSREGKRASGFKAAKDRLTLLLGGNAKGDFKLKLLLVYRSKNPRAMKVISKSTLPIIWKSNRKS
ncbi:tigger transposable element-derived protein 1-like [Parasteatoda tepidariorum]|uniref:tigger transposable element-derived protein 1-like n=1 Tax=Parasteatoda tepidariorum TaxID=114398 RepID=UPI00077FB908|nr:tigger transposable element-derived protein 1-like [Parasteatoda tepidariorum]